MEKGPLLKLSLKRLKIDTHPWHLTMSLLRCNWEALWVS